MVRIKRTLKGVERGFTQARPIKMSSQDNCMPVSKASNRAVTVKTPQTEKFVGRVKPKKPIKHLVNYKW